MKSATNPYFCLAGIIVKRDDYEKILITSINSLKEKYFSKTSVIFHYTEMKKNVGEFSMFKDGETRNAFWKDFISSVSATDFTTIGVYFNEVDFKTAYKVKHNKHYNYAFTNLMNTYITFLKENDGMGAIVFESRQWQENAEIQDTFMHILECGTDLFSSEECKKYLSTLGFFTKKDNCIGLQVADFVPDSFVRELNGAKNYHNVRNTFISRVYGNDNSEGKTEYPLGLRKLF